MTVAAPAAKRRAPLVSGRRVGVGLLLAAVGIGSVFYAPAFAALVLGVAIGALWEFRSLTERKGATSDFPVALAAVVAYVGLTYFGLIHRFEGGLLAATVILALGTTTFGARGGYIARSGYTLLGVLYIGKLLSYFIAIRMIPEVGALLTVGAIVLIAFTDIFAMLVGVTIGRTPLTPISPRKTVEGAVAGLVATTIAGVALTMVPQLHLAWWQGLLIGAITSLAAQAGDLVESALKRDARVKDAGSAIAGHGGLLDRFDSYLFGGIAFYFALWLVGFADPHLHELMRSAP